MPTLGAMMILECWSRKSIWLWNKGNSCQWMITDCSYTKMADTSNSSSLGEDYTTLSNADSPTDAFQESSTNGFFQPDSMENKTLANVTKGSESWGKPLFGSYQRIVPQMPLVGYPGPMFYAINYSAFICICVVLRGELGNAPPYVRIRPKKAIWKRWIRHVQFCNINQRQTKSCVVLESNPRWTSGSVPGHRRSVLQYCPFDGQGLLRVHGPEPTGSVLRGDRSLQDHVRDSSVVRSSLHVDQFLQFGGDRQVSEARAIRLEVARGRVRSTNGQFDHLILSRTHRPVWNMVSI